MLMKVPNSNCFSRVITFFGLSILFPICFTLSSQASEAADNNERAPLLINENRVARDHVLVRVEEGQNVQNLEQYLAQLDVNGNSAPLDPIVVRADHLVKKETKTPEAEMDKITTYMYYVKDEEYHEEIFKDARKGGYYVEQPEAFKQLLLDRAFQAATEGPLSSYLQELNTIILALQRVAPQLQQRITILNQRVTFFTQAIEIIKQKESEARQEQNRVLAEQQRKMKELQATNKKLWIAIPVVSLVVGGVAAGIAVACTHIFWH